MRDEEFLRNKVPMTKSEVRAISLDKLDLRGKKRLLDIGAGTGSVSIQAARQFPQLQVTAIERNPQGIDIIQQNLNRFQLSNFHLIAGEAPKDLPLQAFDAIFVGGSGKHLAEIIQYAAQTLTNQGTLVLNFILLENALQAQDILEQYQFQKLEIVEINVAKWHQLGSGHYFKPNNPTIVMAACQGGQSKNEEN